MIRRSIVPLCLALTATAGLAEQQSRVEIEVNSWDQEVSGQIQIVEQGIGDLIDLDSDLALSSDTVTDARIIFHPSRRTEIRFATMSIGYAGDAVVSRTIEFAGEVFTISSRIVSDLNLDYHRAGFAWQFLASDDGRFRIGPLIEAKGFEGDASLTAPDLSTPVSVGETFEAAFGSAGLALDLEPNDRVHVFGEFTTLVGADVGDMTDLEIGVKVAIFGPLTVQAGFRSIVIDVVDNDDAIDFDMDGIFFGAGLRF